MGRIYHAELDDEPTYERIEAFGGGMDSFTRSTLLPPDASQLFENVIVPDNLSARTRPGADRLGDGFAGAVQGLLYFDTPTYEQLIAIVANALYYYGGGAWTPITTQPWAPSNEVVGAQGVDKALLTDGVEMRTWDGAALSVNLATGGTNDPPGGATVLLWHAGRMWAAGFGGGTAGKENDALWGSNLLDFGAGQWDGGSQNIRIGGGEGDPLVGLASLSASADKGFIMAVLKQNSVWLLNTDPDKAFTDYQASTSALGMAERATDGIGCVGRKAYCVLGNDLIFVSPDKTIRSLSRMQAAASQFAISPPMSLPMQRYMDRINWDYASGIAVRKYQHLALFAVPLDGATYNNTVMVWNGRLQRWTGIWTGWKPVCWEVTRFNGFNELVHGDTEGNVRRWKDNDDASLDATYQDDSAPVLGKVYTRAMLFGEPICPKDGYHAELRFSKSNGTVRATLVADDSDARTWDIDVTQQGPDLPVDLPFDLASSLNIPSRRGLRGIRPFNECYLKIEGLSGWFDLRNVSLSAFINPVKNQ